VVGADESLRELVEHVVIFGQELTGDVERDAVGPVRPDAVGKPVGERVQGYVPRCARKRLAARRANERMRCAETLRGGLRGEMQRAPLAAELAEVRRMIRVAAH